MCYKGKGGCGKVKCVTLESAGVLLEDGLVTRRMEGVLKGEGRVFYNEKRGYVTRREGWLQEGRVC